MSTSGLRNIVSGQTTRSIGRLPSAARLGERLLRELEVLAMICRCLAASDFQSARLLPWMRAMRTDRGVWIGLRIEAAESAAADRSAVDEMLLASSEHGGRECAIGFDRGRKAMHVMHAATSIITKSTPYSPTRSLI